MAQEGRNTFASKVKGEISRNKGLIARNKKAFTYGMLLCGKSFSEQSISMTTENKHVAKLYAKLIFQQIPMQTSVTTREYNGNFQQPTYAVSVDDGEDRKTILAFFGHRQGGGYNVELLEGEQARHAFLAGAMLSCSNISDPRKDYHLEFVLAGEQTALFLMQVLDSLSLNFKRTTRRGQQIVYCKDSKSIEELLTMVGATGAMMDVVNVKIYKDMRNKVNRVTNCETSNIEKTVSAATVQAADILSSRSACLTRWSLRSSRRGRPGCKIRTCPCGSWGSCWASPARESTTACKKLASLRNKLGPKAKPKALPLTLALALAQKKRNRQKGRRERGF